MTIYSEFLGALNENNKEPKDIVFVGSDDGEYEIWFPEFINQITREETNLKHLPYDLIVVFSNNDKLIRIGHLDTAGSDWLLVKAFVKKESIVSVTNIVSDQPWNTVEELNE